MKYFFKVDAQNDRRRHWYNTVRVSWCCVPSYAMHHKHFTNDQDKKNGGILTMIFFKNIPLMFKRYKLSWKCKCSLNTNSKLWFCFVIVAYYKDPKKRNKIGKCHFEHLLWTNISYTYKRAIVKIKIDYQMLISNLIISVEIYQKS